MKVPCETCGKEIERHIFCCPKCKFKFHNAKGAIHNDEDTEGVEVEESPVLNTKSVADVPHKKGYPCERCSENPAPKKIGKKRGPKLKPLKLAVFSGTPNIPHKKGCQCDFCQK